MSSEVLRVKLRIKNNIYTVKMGASALTDVLLKGLDSLTVQTVMRSTPESLVTGQFACPVEVLSAVNQSDTSTQENMMEIEVRLPNGIFFFAKEVKDFSK